MISRSAKNSSSQPKTGHCCIPFEVVKYTIAVEQSSLEKLIENSWDWRNNFGKVTAGNRQSRKRSMNTTWREKYELTTTKTIQRDETNFPLAGDAPYPVDSFPS